MERKGPRSNIRLDLKKDEKGCWCYPATTRSDGSVRKEYRVRPDHPDLQLKYTIKAHREEQPAEELKPTLSESAPKPSAQKMEEVVSVVETTRPPNQVQVGSDSVDAKASKENEEKPVVRRPIFSLPRVENFYTHVLEEPTAIVKNPEVKSVKPTPVDAASAAASVATFVTKTEPKENVKLKTPSDSEEEAVIEDSLSPNKKVDSWLNAGRYVEPNKEFSLSSAEEKFLEEIIQKILSCQLSPEEKAREWNEMVGSYYMMMSKYECYN